MNIQALEKLVSKMVADSRAYAKMMEETYTQIQALLNSPREVPLGINLASPVDWGTEFPFIDIMKQSRPFYSQVEGLGYDAGMKVPLERDQFGNPKSLKPKQMAEALVFVDMRGKVGTGVYTLAWKGKGTFQVASEGHVYGTFTESPATVELNRQEVGSVAVRVLSIPDPANNPTQITFRKIMPPEWKNQTFRPKFVGDWEFASVYRFMDWEWTNASPLMDWKDRPTPQLATQAGGTGVALEHCLELSALTGKDPWLCIPHQATDAFVEQMAALVSLRLPPSQKVWLEYSNECWNNAPKYPQSAYCRQKGVAAKLSNNTYEAQLRWYASRSVRCFNIFTQALGPSRVVKVLAAHGADPWTGATILGHPVDGRPAGAYADALAIAPYWGHWDQVHPTNPGMLSVDQILDRCEELIKLNKPTLLQFAKIAEAGKLQLVAYEGGQHLVKEGDPAATEKFIAVNRHPRMKDLILQDLRQWRDIGGGLFCLFSSMGPYKEHGSWGHLEHTFQDTTQAPKYQAALEFNARG